MDSGCKEQTVEKTDQAGRMSVHQLADWVQLLTGLVTLLVMLGIGTLIQIVRRMVKMAHGHDETGRHTTLKVEGIRSVFQKSD
jgi:hypothetical protein